VRASINCLPPKLAVFFKKKLPPTPMAARVFFFQKNPGQGIFFIFIF
jgi:hypothetical protein